MSLADNLIQAAAPAYNIVHADTWTVLSSGLTFSGDAQTEAPFVLEGETGGDARERTMLYVERPIPVLARGTRISGKGANWTVVGDVDDNPANQRAKFEIQKIVAGKDS